MNYWTGASPPQEANLSKISESINMRDDFQRWLFEGNTVKYTPEVVLSCIDKISKYAVRKKIAVDDLWKYTSHDVFEPVYNKLVKSILLRIFDRNTYGVFIIAGNLYLSFLKEKPLIHKDETNNNAVKEKEEESIVVPDSLPKDQIDPEAVIAWLVTQPNANGALYLENVVRQYMWALRSTPAKLETSLLPDSVNIFTCRTPEALNAYWDIFKAAPNYKQVNRRTSGGFSAGMSCLLRYLQYLTGEGLVANSPTKEQPRPVEIESTMQKRHKLDPVVVEQCKDVLSAYFSNGYRLNSPIEMVRFRSFAKEFLDEELPTSDEMLKSYISACGMTFDGKVYVVSMQTKERIKKSVEDYFAKGAQVIFFAEFYARNENWLLEANIVSEEMLNTILHSLFPNLSYTLTYFGYTDASVPVALEKEILRVWGEDVTLAYAQLAERLKYIPLDRIKYALAQNGNFIWCSLETYSHVSRIDIRDEEREAICKKAQLECDAKGYVPIANLPCGEIKERNYELTDTAVQNAIYRICLSDMFEKKGKIITRIGSVFDVMSIMKKYCKTIDRCSLSDLLNLEREMTGEVHRWTAMEAGNTFLVRIDKNTYVADRYVHFNAEVIDEAIGLFVKSDYLPLKSFTTFGAFPDCGQTWNLFLLESYCRRFSRKFRFDTLSVNSRNAGAVIRRTCILNYTDIMTDAVANADVALNQIEVGKFLFESGYTGRSTNAKIGEIINHARGLRERTV